MVDKYRLSETRWLHEVESGIFSEGRELTRKILQGHIDSRGVGNIGKSITTKNKTILSHKRLRERKLQTMFGEVSIVRIGYSSRHHSGFFPLDAILNLPNNSYSYGLQYFISKHASLCSFSEVMSITQEVSGVKIGTRQIMKIIHSCSRDFDEFYEHTSSQEIANDFPILVLTTDGKGIVMRTEGLREATKKKLEKEEKKIVSWRKKE